MRIATTIAALGVIYCSLSTAGEAGDSELKKLQGQWKITYAKMSDNIVPLDKLGMDRLVIHDGKLKIQNGDMVLKAFGLKVIPGQEPAAIDWINLDINKALPCIYELKGDELQMCFPLLPKKGGNIKVVIERPKKFDTEKKPFGLLKATRVKSSTVQKDKNGFTSLFNSRDLTGWKLKGGASLAGKAETSKKRFQVQDAAIVIDYKSKGNMVIETEKSFDKDVIIRFEYMAEKGCNNDLYFRGLKFDIREGGVKNLKFGKWHQFEIVAKGKQVVFKNDGEIQRTQNAKTAASPLGIRAEFGPIKYRKLEYKVLD